MKKMNNKGFSLIELIIVIAIMAVLVAVIAPNLTGYIGKSKVNTDKSNADTIESALTTCLQDYTTDELIGALKDPAGYTTIDEIVSITDANAAASKATVPSDFNKTATGATTFEANVKKALSKYVSKDNQGKDRIMPKQDGFTFYIKIEGSYDAGYTCKVKCANAKFDQKTWTQK
jgi:type IV pilus assembly protein PilA